MRRSDSSREEKIMGLMNGQPEASGIIEGCQTSNTTTSSNVIGYNNTCKVSSLTNCANNNRIGFGDDDEDHDDVNNISPSGASTSMMVKSSNFATGTMTSRSRSHSHNGMVNVMTRIQVSLLIILFVTLAAGVTGVHINDLRVPSVIRNGTEEFVILDCDYHVEEEEKSGLVVKWFLNKGHSPVYQWIPNKKPQDLGILRGKLNLDYKADSDAYKMYRALKIVRPTTELSGEWICRVSTFEGDAYKAATMVIFAPEKDMKLTVVETRKPGFVNISCWATGVFPEPKLTVYHGENKEQKVEDMVFSTRFVKGAYDVSAYKVIEDANLSSISSVFDCELNIPNTNYLTRRSHLYEPGSLALKDGRSMGTGGSSRLESYFFSSPSKSLFLVTTLLVVVVFPPLTTNPHNPLTSWLFL